jgi:glycosyltransferase involved in cell wall biosynthesis
VVAHQPGSPIKTAVVITTYNRPDALRATLDAYVAQSTRAFELIVADDGSGRDTVDLVESFAKGAPFQVRHVWQDDRGFRAAAVRNKAVAACDAAYVIFTDGDCIPARDFVARHLALAQRGCFLSGNRVLLSQRLSRRVLDERLPVHDWSAPAWLWAWLRRDVNRLLPLLAVPDGAWRTRRSDEWRGVKTCNLSVWREDLVRVNGLDESYSGWGLEDSDLVIRLLHAGIRHKSARFAAPVFHLWHVDNDRSRLAENQKRLDELLHSNRTRAALGLDQYATRG